MDDSASDGRFHAGSEQVDPHAHACCEEHEPSDDLRRPSRRSMLGLGAMIALLPACLNGRFNSVGRSTTVWVGTVRDVRARLARDRRIYVPDARAYLMPIDGADAPSLKSFLTKDELSGASYGFVALHQKCPHLGCRIPYCDSSGWFECPCHGSQFAATSDRRGGPAPSGMSRRTVVVRGGRVGIDVSTLHTGFSAATRVSDNGATGPHCVGG